MAMYRFLDPPETRKEKRLIWAATRSVLENAGVARKKSGKKSKSRWNLFLRLMKIFALFLKLSGNYKKGYGNAKTITVSDVQLHFPKLPDTFKGLRILHLSDLHLDSIPGFAALITNKIKDLDFDLCVLTGDYRRDSSGSFSHILKPFMILSKYIEAPLGTFAVLGNHDTFLMARYEDQSGIELLINESVEIEKDGQKILITGTDDPFNFYTEQALLSLETKGYDFKIALVHTSELAKTAAANKYDLYLCGHTHGGQICIKKGVPIISHQFEGKEYNNGLWEIDQMKGYTSRGVGVSGMPVRFNCPPEVTIFTLNP
ncbi:MAG: metallophosphoesterase [Bacteroidota bacterium]|nr:metallophosphoesterase [Bacteroidota bacterium]